MLRKNSAHSRRAENGRERRRGYRVDGRPGHFSTRACAAGVTIGGLTIPAPPTDAQNHRRRTRRRGLYSGYAGKGSFIKPMIAIVTAPRAARRCMPAPAPARKGTSSPDFRWNGKFTIHSEIPMLAGGNMPLMQQALSAVHGSILWRGWPPWAWMMHGRWQAPTFTRCVRCEGFGSA